MLRIVMARFSPPSIQRVLAMPVAPVQKSTLTVPVGSGSGVGETSANAGRARKG